MIDIRFVVQCLRRRWWLILSCTLVAALLGGIWSFVTSEDETETPVLPFTAEATIYVNGYDSDEMMGYNYKVDEGYMIGDARRIVVSDSVAGEVRRKYGEDVIISSPFWKNPETDGTFYTRFIFVNASAETKQIAIDAANLAAQLAVEKMKEQVCFKTAEVYEPAVLKTVFGEAADFGANSMDPSDLENTDSGGASRLSIKTILVSGFCAFAVTFGAVIAYYYLNRRFREPYDVERILGVPLLGTVREGHMVSDLEMSLIPLIVDEICERNDVGQILTCGLPGNDAVLEVSNLLKDRCAVLLLGELNLQGDEIDRDLVEEAGGVVVVVTEDAADSSQIARVTRVLNLLQIPVAGAIFVRRESRPVK